MTALPTLRTTNEQGTETIVVGVSDINWSDSPKAVLTTYALSSCIAVTVYDPVRVAGGMIHFALPKAIHATDRLKRSPAMFADTGIPLLFRQLYQMGCLKSNLIVKAIGGGHMYDTNGTFDIGKRNYSMLRKLMWRNSVLIAAEDIGGKKSRTVRFHIGSGRVTVQQPGGVEYEI